MLQAKDMNNTMRASINAEVKIRVDFPESHQEMISNANLTHMSS